MDRQAASSLGVLSVHLAGAPCAVGCPFCYLGAREKESPLGAREGGPPLDALVQLRSGRERAAAGRRMDELERAAGRLSYAELAIAVSEPVPRGDIARLVAVASARGVPVALTTTREIIDADLAETGGALFSGVARVNLSVDPWKMGDETSLRGDGANVMVAEVARVAAALKRAHPRIELIAIATLSTPGFAHALVDDGLLATLVDLPVVDGVALSALKPPPPFCDRAFWLRTLAKLRPLLDRALDRKLHLDCYVAARLLGIGGCPARPDLSPSADGRIAFRSCVYAPRADAIVATADDLDAHVAGFTAPAVCPFDTRLT